MGGSDFFAREANAPSLRSFGDRVPMMWGDAPPHFHDPAIGRVFQPEIGGEVLCGRPKRDNVGGRLHVARRYICNVRSSIPL